MLKVDKYSANLLERSSCDPSIITLSWSAIVSILSLLAVVNILSLINSSFLGGIGLSIVGGNTNRPF